MAENVDILLDATVVREPESGVQRAVRREAEELQRILPACRLRRSGALTRNAGCRILWQQCVLPFMDYSALYAMAYTAPLLCRQPYLLNVHDVIALMRPELCSCRNLLQMRLLLALSIRKAARIIVSTEHVANQVKRLFSGSKITVSPLGIDYGHFAKGGGPLPSLAGRRYYLFVGNIEPKKGLFTLLAAFLKNDSSAKLVLAGRLGWKCSGLVEIIRRFPQRIIWLGRVADEELPALYANAEAFVMPSIEEGFGLPVLEAMAAGVPVIHSSSPALLEVAGGAALEFEVGSADSLANAIRRLERSTALRQELVEAGRKRASQFSWRARAEVSAALLKELL